MPPYASETFDASEQEILRRYVTNLDGPVFALVNLPEVVKGALFARYSRSNKSLRRLFLDEFVDDLDITGDTSLDATVGLRRAEQLYDRVFGDYGDESVAQLGGVHLACEQSSNLLTKILERGRLMAYLEQSTRYVPYDSRLSSGHYRYYRDPILLDSPHGARYVGEMDRMFDTYAALLPRIVEHLSRAFPRSEQITDFAWRQSIRARALDALRGLLPAGSLSNVGIYGTGQSYELLLIKMRSHPLPEARAYAEMMLVELRKVIPSFLTRVDRQDRGMRWSAYLAARRDETAEVVETLFGGAPGGTAGETAPPSVKLTDVDPFGEEKVLAAICYPYAQVSDAAISERVRSLTLAERTSLLRAYIGERENRRHRPGRALERTGYRFDIVSDYGAFRDLQRHRMLTIEWQPLSTRLGFTVPDLVFEAGCEAEYTTSLERSGELARALEQDFPEQAAYAVALGYQIRYVMQMSAREAMHVIELRSGPQGHPAYRVVVQDMYRLIDAAGHHAIAAAMAHTDLGEVELGRLAAEERRARRLEGGTPVNGTG